MFLSGRSLQQSDANQTSVEVYVEVISSLKHQRCRNLCFWKFVSLHPICKKEVRLRPECFLSIREYASYYRLPLWRRVVGQYIELEPLPYLNFRLHLKLLDAPLVDLRKGASLVDLVSQADLEMGVRQTTT